jgi:Right handed beta helix region
MIQSTALVVLCLFVAGCYQTNGAFNPDAQACSESPDCASVMGSPICDDGVCVQCTAQDSSACTGMTPFCGDDKKCQACTTHAQCSDGTAATSGVCTPSGACAKVEEVAYVDPDGTANSECIQPKPCPQVSSALATNRPYVLFKGTIMENVFVDARPNLSFLALPGAKIKGIASGPVIELRNASKLTISDLEITEGLGTGGHGISLSGSANSVTLLRARLFKNGGIGLNAPAGNVDISQSTITENSGVGVLVDGGAIKLSQSTFTSNTGGGLLVGGSTFEVTNSIFSRNGGVNSTRGGVSLRDITTVGNKFEFNTVAQNLANNGVVSGVQCVSVTAPLQMNNSIVYNNAQMGVTMPDQVGGSANCTWSYSLIGPKALTDGNGLLSADPQFQAVDDFNLKPSSPALNAADPAATLKVDFHGKPRPAGIRADMGAIEMQ